MKISSQKGPRVVDNKRIEHESLDHRFLKGTHLKGMDCSTDECENMDLRFIGEKVKRIRFSLTKGSEQAST